MNKPTPVTKKKTAIKHVASTKPHEYQDTKYGKNMRVCNPTKDDKYRDTVTGLTV